MSLHLGFFLGATIGSSQALADGDHAKPASSGSVESHGSYYVGDGDNFDFAVEVKNGTKAFLYLTEKPLNEPVSAAEVRLKPAIESEPPIKFEPIKDAPGAYQAVLPSAASLPGQISIVTADDSDSAETVVPSYKQGNVPGVTGSQSGDSSKERHSISIFSVPSLMVFLGGIFFSLLVGGVFLFFRRRHLRMAGIGAMFAFASFQLTGFSTSALAHGDHDHSGPAIDSSEDSGAAVVMPKKSQILIELKTVQASKAPVPGVIKTYGHVIPRPQFDAIITAPQSGFLRGIQGLTLGTKVKRGQLLVTLQAVGQIRLESPIDGEISEINAVEGSRVDAGSKLLRVTNPSILWVDAEMFASQLVDLPRVIDISVSVEGVSGPVKAKMLNAVSPVSEESRTAKVYVELVSAPEELHIGMMATVSFALDRKIEAILLPASAVLNRSGDRIVFVQTGPETFVARMVSIDDGPEAGTVLITAGVNDGERVVVSGNYQLLMKAK